MNCINLIYNICMWHVNVFVSVTQACVQAVRASAELPYEEGMKMEKELFLQLNSSGQARAQQYAFFAERAVSRVRWI
jgi:hypothetical protein